MSLRTVMQRSLASTTRRYASTAAPKNPLIPLQYQGQTAQSSFRKDWLSDPSTYPIIAIMTVATCFCVGMSANALGRYKGVKLNPAIKSDIIPDHKHAYAENVQITEVITRRPISFLGLGKGFKSLRQEGLGVDHEEWKKTQHNKQFEQKVQ